MKAILIIGALFSFAAVASPEVIRCKNTVNKSSFTMVRNDSTIASLVVKLDGMNNTIRNDFTYTAKDLRGQGSVIVFEKKNASRTEVIIQEVAPGQVLAMLTFQYMRYDSAVETILMTCGK